MNHLLCACASLKWEEGGNARYGHIRVHGHIHAHSASWNYTRWKEEVDRPPVREVELEAIHYREGVVLLVPTPIRVSSCLSPTPFPSASLVHRHCQESAGVEEASRGDHWEVRNAYK